MSENETVLWDVRLIDGQNEELWQTEEDALRLALKMAADHQPEKVRVVRDSDRAEFRLAAFLYVLEEKRTDVVWDGATSCIVAPSEDGHPSPRPLEESPLIRTPVPGGWLVVLFGHGVTFLPDDEHRWDGRSVWSTLGRSAE